jgi:hypothetical protein
MSYLIPGKIIAILVFLIGTFLCAYAPFMFKGLRKNPGALGIINAFGGGLFLAGGIIHILPEALRVMDEWYKPVDHDDDRLRFLAEAVHEEEETVEHFPWPAFGASIIFCLQLVLEKTVGRSANASWLFAAGMGLHATFAGLALGLEKTSGSFIALVIGIIAHKFSESIAVGVRIFEEVKPGQIQKYIECENIQKSICTTAEKTKNGEIQANQVYPMDNSAFSPKSQEHGREQVLEVQPKTPDSNFFPHKIFRHRSRFNSSQARTFKICEGSELYRPMAFHNNHSFGHQHWYRGIRRQQVGRKFPFGSLRGYFHLHRYYSCDP